MHLQPCPLCMLQRVALLLTLLPLLAGVWLGRWRIAAAGCAVLAMLAALLGGGLAVRHLWLQQLPAEAVPECGPGLDYLLDTLPISEALGAALRGSGECAEVVWTLYSISIPGWTLIGFSLLLLGSAMLLGRCQRRTPVVP